MSNAVHKGDVKLLFIPCLPDPSQGCPSCCLAALIVKLPFFVQWKLTPCNFHQQAIFLASGSTENTFFWFSIPLDNFSPCPTASNIWKGLSCLLFFRLNISRSCDMVSGCLSILFITFLDWDPVSLKNVCFLKADYWLSLPHWKFLKTWTVGWRVWVSHLRVFIFLDFPLCSHTFIQQRSLQCLLWARCLGAWKQQCTKSQQGVVVFNVKTTKCVQKLFPSTL